MKKIVVQFRHTDSTKGAHKYQEVDENGNKLDYANAQIGSLYLRKSAVGDEAIPAVTVTVEELGA